MFIIIIIKNRFNILDCSYVAIVNKICTNDDLSNYDAVDVDGYGTFINQQTIMPIFKKSMFISARTNCPNQPEHLYS